MHVTYRMMVRVLPCLVYSWSDAWDTTGLLAHRIGKGWRYHIQELDVKNKTINAIYIQHVFVVYIAYLFTAGNFAGYWLRNSNLVA